MASDPQKIDIVLGTMTFGSQVDEPESKEFLNYFLSHGGHNIDTAIAYNKGKTETIIGNVLTPEQKKATYIASKVNKNTEPHLALTAVSVREQTENILKHLQVDHVDLLYLHSPDQKTPIEETLQAINELHKEGKFKEFGLSNYPAWEVVYIYHICKTKGYVLPTVYQGMYNAITRDCERELFPALHFLKIKFYAYNPIAGGLLTGKHKFTDGGSELKGRFDRTGGTQQNKNYIDRYWKPEVFEALGILEQACAKHKISITEAAFRWMRHHSKLVAGDGIIFGATKMEQMKENVAFSLSPEKLPEEVVDAIDAAWKRAKPVCPPYFRY
eukprot:Phypoly_transcript_13829.p1 GENE.Phypoly_transcript_13829~~Phypoly_transcript_13829.p1  ORF type:complete len:336 (+),score=58.95 Phypoly_transcript_13829:25-1008(+)